MGERRRARQSGHFPRSLRASVKRWYCETVKNLTVAVPDEVYRLARVRAAESGTSVSALVTAYLKSLASGSAEFDRKAQLQRDVLADVTEFRAGDRLSREEVHDRAVR